IANFGTYSVNEANPTFTIRYEGSTFPNRIGTEETRPAVIEGDELRITNPAPSTGGPTSQQDYRRTKKRRAKKFSLWLLRAGPMSALGQKRTLMGFAVRWRNVLVFDRNYVAFQALLDSCHSALWLDCRCLPCVSRDILVAHAKR